MKKTMFAAVLILCVLAFVSCGKRNPAGPAVTTKTATITASATAELSSTATQINTPSETATLTLTLTSNLTSTYTGTRIFTPTITVTRTGTETATITPTWTGTSTVTVSLTASISATITETATETPVCSATTTPTALNCSYPGNEVVISQIYGGASSSVTGASYNYDFVVLHNRSDCAFTMTNWSIQYATGSGTTISSKLTLNATIQAGGFYLIRMYGPGLDGGPLPAYDASSAGMSIASNAGKFYLYDQTANVPLAAYGCPAVTVKDFVGYGGAGGASCLDGSSPVGSPLNNQGCMRKSSGCQDTNNNLSDFTIGIPSPDNSASAAVICP